MNNSDVLKVPLIVSVVGHKDITTPETVLKAYFDAFWQKLRAELGENTPFHSPLWRMAIRHNTARLPVDISQPDDPPLQPERKAE